MDPVPVSRRSLASFAEEIHSRKGNFSLTAESNSRVEITFVKCPRKSKFLNAILGSKVTVTLRNKTVGSEAQMQEIKTSTRGLKKQLAKLEDQLKQQPGDDKLSWSVRPDDRSLPSDFDIDLIDPLPLDDSEESTNDSDLITGDSIGVTKEHIETDDLDSFSSASEIGDRKNDLSEPQKQAAFLHPGQNRGKVSTFDPDDVEYPTNSLSASDLSDDSVDSVLGKDPLDSPDKLEQDKRDAADFLEKLNNGSDF